MMKFKVGDTVRINEKERIDEKYSYTKTGSEGVIKETEGNNHYFIQFNKLTGNKGESINNERFTIQEKYLDLIKPAKPENAREKLKRLLDL